ncbi:Inorganic phosphate transporter pho84 [Apophysomyces sp. BC1015]|nr:Inorganic phosphate transporter pho84 [Apophysomyces sp. BC1015]
MPQSTEADDLAASTIRTSTLDELDDTRSKLDWRQMPSNIQGPFKGMVSFGQLVGQLLFGFLGDAFGRKAIYGFELLLIILGTVNCATAGSAVEGVGTVGFLAFWRFVLGVGIGGDYPMSATIMSEWASSQRRGQLVALIFSMQGFGNVCASLVTMIVLLIFKGPVDAKTSNLDYVWRICIGLGCIPAVLVVYARLVMPESPRYAVNVQNDQEKARLALEKTRWHSSRNQEKLVQSNGHVPTMSMTPERQKMSQKEIRRANLRDFRVVNEMVT